MTSRARPAFLRRLARLSAREWLDLAEAQFELLVAQYIVATRRTGQLVSRAALDPFGDDHAAAPSAPNADPRPEQLALAIGRAAEHGCSAPSVSCARWRSNACSIATVTTEESSRSVCD